MNSLPRSNDSISLDLRRDKSYGILRCLYLYLVVYLKRNKHNLYFPSQFQLLDSRDLKISGVVDEASGQKLDFSVAEPGFVGSKVEIKLPTSSEKM